MSETREQILEEIKTQGDLVRKLKAAKEPKEKVSVSHKNINVLLSFFEKSACLGFKFTNHRKINYCWCKSY